MAKGNLIIISAPSGTGKTTLLKKVMARLQGLEFSVSHTTRAPRAGEQNGVAYHFVDKDGFEKLIEQDGFLEWANVHGNYYGTSIAAVADKQQQHIDVVLDIDVQGAAILREKKVADTVFIFIAPPSLEELEERLRGRGTEAEENVAIRLANVRSEMAEAHRYDYLIVNDTLEDAAAMLEAVILAERAKSRRMLSGKPLSL